MQQQLTIDMPNGDVISYPGDLVNAFMEQNDLTLNDVIKLLKKQYMDSSPNQEELF